MPDTKSSEFIVRLEGLKLSPEAEARINGEIQAAVMREVARIDFKGDLVSRIPRKEWLGFWLRDRAFDLNAATVLKVNEIRK